VKAVTEGEELSDLTLFVVIGHAFEEDGNLSLFPSLKDSPKFAAG
jgi:hypothetical protein